MLRRVMQKVTARAVRSKIASASVTKSSIFNLSKNTNTIRNYSTNRPRVPQRKSTMPSPTKKKENPTQKIDLTAKSISLSDIKNRNEVQEIMLQYQEQKITLGEFLREFGMRDQIYFPIQVVNGHETGAIALTKDTFPEYKPNPDWPQKLDFEVKQYITLFVFTGENTLRLFEPNTKLKLEKFSLAHLLAMIINDRNQTIVSHLIIDPGTTSFVLEENEITALPYYRQVALSEANIEALWNYSPFSLNTERVAEPAEENPKILAARHYSPKMAPFLILTEQNFDLTQTDPTLTGVHFTDNNTILPIWTADDLTQLYAQAHPEIDYEKYKFFAINGEDLWTQLGTNKELISRRVIQFNPDSPKTRLFNGALAEEIHQATVPEGWEQQMQVQANNNNENYESGNNSKK